MASNLVYCYPADNRLSGVTGVVTSGTASTTFPIAGLTDGDPSLPVTFTGTACTVTFDLGSALQVDLAALIAHNLTGTVTIQGHTADSWGSPTVSQVVPTVTQDADGYWPNRWIDLSVPVPSDATRTLRYWRLVVSGNTANVSIGELWLARKRTLAQNYDWGAIEVDDAPTVWHETDAGVAFAYSLGVRRRRFSAEFDGADATGAAIRDLWRAARGRARSFLIVPLGDEGEVWQVRCAEDAQPTTQVSLDRRTLPLAFEEVSRGLA